VATNTIAQGDTRETGLKRIVDTGGTIIAAERSMSWPGAAAVIVSVVHVFKSDGEAHTPTWRILDGKTVGCIDSRLMAFAERPDPVPLGSNAETGFAGAKLFGQGFVLDLGERNSLVAKDPRNARWIQQYIGGEDVNRLPDLIPRRFVINFGHVSLEEASGWPDLVTIAQERVRPERQTNKRGTYQTYWWRLGETGTALYDSLSGKRRCLVNCQVGRHLAFAWQGTDVLFAHTICVFALDADSAFAVMQSRVHEVWARLFASSMKDDLRYTPSDCFDTYPFPPDGQLLQTPALEAAGKTYYDFRASLMADEQVRASLMNGLPPEGLTATYNRFHDPDETLPGILRLRELHAAMDRAVLDAYGWTDLAPACAFLLDYEEEDDQDDPSRARQKRKPWRYRWPDDVRDDVLARLLALNAERAAAERRLGIEAVLEAPAGSGAPRAAAGPKRGGRKKGGGGQGALFE
jgi:hypothetical protein